MNQNHPYRQYSSVFRVDSHPETESEPCSRSEMTPTVMFEGDRLDDTSVLRVDRERGHIEFHDELESSPRNGNIRWNNDVIRIFLDVMANEYMSMRNAPSGQATQRAWQKIVDDVKSNVTVGNVDNIFGANRYDVNSFVENLNTEKVINKWNAMRGTFHWIRQHRHVFTGIGGSVVPWEYYDKIGSIVTDDPSINRQVIVESMDIGATGAHFYYERRGNNDNNNNDDDEGTRGGGLDEDREEEMGEENLGTQTQEVVNNDTGFRENHEQWLAFISRSHRLATPDGTPPIFNWEPELTFSLPRRTPDIAVDQQRGLTPYSWQLRSVTPALSMNRSENIRRSPLSNVVTSSPSGTETMASTNATQTAQGVEHGARGGRGRSRGANNMSDEEFQTILSNNNADMANRIERLLEINRIRALDETDRFERNIRQRRFEDQLIRRNEREADRLERLNEREASRWDRSMRHDDMVALMSRLINAVEENNEIQQNNNRNNQTSRQ
ncbi:hypothetical protein INT45_010708 [Circinella minor]|uniref:Uncharacterized protein n=1 Tax=Circinella minor TaxID=1195481 RepID=A0A8H7VCY0_9FUNG|nr:hypothetical protein INT45_010708 [Circinella minor]